MPPVNINVMATAKAETILVDATVATTATVDACWLVRISLSLSLSSTERWQRQFPL